MIEEAGQFLQDPGAVLGVEMIDPEGGIDEEILGGVPGQGEDVLAHVGRARRPGAVDGRGRGGEQEAEPRLARLQPAFRPIDPDEMQGQEAGEDQPGRQGDPGLRGAPRRQIRPDRSLLNDPGAARDLDAGLVLNEDDYRWLWREWVEGS